MNSTGSGVREGGGSSRRLDAEAGNHIRDVLDEAWSLASETGDEVTFDFNGIEHLVLPSDTYEAARVRAEERAGFKILSAEDEQRRARESTEKTQREWAAAIEAAGVATEQEMRDAEVPWPKTPEDLSAYIASLVSRPHDYGTCVYAMSMAATAAFQYVAGKLGVSGFQASCADMDILKRTRHLKDGFRIVSYEELLYPQYWDAERTPIYEAALKDEDTRQRFADKARKRLAEGAAHPAVERHWRRIADLAPAHP